MIFNGKLKVWVNFRTDICTIDVVSLYPNIPHEEDLASENTKKKTNK